MTNIKTRDNSQHKSKHPVPKKNKKKCERVIFKLKGWIKVEWTVSYLELNLDSHFNPPN